MTAFSTQQVFFERFMPAQASDTSMQNSNTEKDEINPILLQTFEYFDSKTETFMYHIQWFENYPQIKYIFFLNKQHYAQMLLNSMEATNFNMFLALVLLKIPS